MNRLRSAICALTLVLAAPAWGHPHEWVDWGVGLVLDEAKPVTVQSALLELTWDEWYSALVLDDFPQFASGNWSQEDLDLLDTTYGLASPDLPSNLSLTFGGQRITARPRLEKPRTDRKKVTLVYRIPVNRRVEVPTELRASIYDPTFYTDMAIRAKEGAFWVGVHDLAAYAGASSFEHDTAHPYYDGTVFPEVVVFRLVP